MCGRRCPLLLAVWRRYLPDSLVHGKKGRGDVRTVNNVM